jgi:hypothetical protein
MPRTAKAYKLVPAEVPAQAGRAGRSIYRDIVADFVASDLDSALVEVPGRKPNSLNVGLRKAVSVSGAAVSVKMRVGQVYLQKT